MSDGPVLLITGASSGIGEATARQAVESGRRVVLSARSADKLQALAASLGGPDHAIAVPADVTDFASQEMVDTPFFDTPKPDALKADDIARAVLYALDQPKHVDVNEILIRPTSQPT